MTDFIIGFVVCLWAFSFGIHVESTSSLKKALKGSILNLHLVVYALLKEIQDGILRRFM